MASTASGVYNTSHARTTSNPLGAASGSNQSTFAAETAHFDRCARMSNGNCVSGEHAVRFGRRSAVDVSTPFATQPREHYSSFLCPS